MFAPISSVPSKAATGDTELVELLSAMQQREQRLLDIGWPLLKANAPFCGDAVPDIGLLLLDSYSFQDPFGIAVALGTRGSLFVQAIAGGSPAAQAGLTHPAALLAIDGAETADFVPLRSGSWENLVRINAAIAASLAETGSVELQWLGADNRAIRKTIIGTPVCNATLEPRDGERSARADGNRMLIGSNFPGYAYPDAEFAAVIAHEMAHIVLGHPAWLDAVGRGARKGRTNIRLTEREADRLAPWLLANAGHDPLAAGRMMRRWGPKHGGGLLRKRTHSGWDERAILMDEEASKIPRIIAETGSADWSKLFVRDLAR